MVQRWKRRFGDNSSHLLLRVLKHWSAQPAGRHATNETTAQQLFSVWSDSVGSTLLSCGIKGPDFNCRHRQQICLVSKTSIPALRPTQPPTEWVHGLRLSVVTLLFPYTSQQLMSPLKQRKKIPVAVPRSVPCVLSKCTTPIAHYMAKNALFTFLAFSLTLPYFLMLKNAVNC